MQQEVLNEWMNKPIPGPRELVYPTALENGEKLVDITDWPRIVYNAYYLKAMGLKTGLARCYVREGAAERLKKVLSFLPEEYSLLVYDSLRTITVQQELYDLYSVQIRRDHLEMDEEALLDLIDNFVAFPRIDRERPTPHATGGAIDLSLMKQGVEVDMGTVFDDLTEKAETNYYETLSQRQKLSENEQDILKNRRLLYHAMLQAGFVNYHGEWWHFSYGDRSWSAQTGNPVKYGYTEI